MGFRCQKDLFLYCDGVPNVNPSQVKELVGSTLTVSVLNCTSDPKTCGKALTHIQSCKPLADSYKESHPEEKETFRSIKETKEKIKQVNKCAVSKTKKPVKKSSPDSGVPESAWEFMSRT
jgi:hypothetical protein